MVLPLQRSPAITVHIRAMFYPLFLFLVSGACTRPRGIGMGPLNYINHWYARHLSSSQPVLAIQSISASFSMRHGPRTRKSLRLIRSCRKFIYDLLWFMNNLYTGKRRTFIALVTNLQSAIGNPECGVLSQPFHNYDDRISTVILFFIIIILINGSPRGSWKWRLRSQRYVYCTIYLLSSLYKSLH